MIELYQFESCPYCRRVREKLDELEMDYISRNLHPGSAKWTAFKKLNPKGQVPFIVDEEKGVAMDESQEIIKYLEKNYAR